ncbi:MAG TPA: phosphate ABC transporter substrate-binding protein, partial [Psychromonas sp.]
MIYANFIKFIIIALSLGLGSASASAEVVTVVSANNPLTALSKKQIVDIFLGKASRFPDGQQAMPVDQGESAAAHEEFYLKFAGQTPAQI